MNDKPKSFWKKTWKGPRLFLIWLVLMIVTIVAFSIGILTIGKPFTEPEVYEVLISAVVGASLLFGLWLFIRWLRCWRNCKRFLFGLACFVTLIALFYAEEDWRGKYAWEKFKREWEAKGEKFDRQSVVPPPVPDDQNFALTPLVFTSYGQMLTRDGKMIPGKERATNFMNRMQMSIAGDDSLLDWRTNGTGNWQKAEAANLTAWQTYYRALATKTNLFPIAPQPQTPAQDVLLALSKCDSTIEELREESRLPYSRFPLEYDKDRPFDILLPHLSCLKSCGRVLQLRSLAELQNSQSEKALADVKLLLRLTDSIRTEPFLISHLVRIAMANLALQPVWEGLAEHRWSDAQLVELDRELADPDFLSDYKLAMRGEMVLCQEGVIDYLQRHPEQISNMSDDGGSTRSAPTVSINDLIPSGWFYQNQLRCSRFMVQQCLPLADLEHRIISPANLRQANAALDLEFKHASPYNRLEVLFLPALGGAVKKFANAQSSVDLARVAIALERYRLAHGEYPESLDALSPQFIAKLPHDIINGQPLHYRRISNGQFFLYSVGWNETDDGGEVGLRKDGSVDISAGDWVWRYLEK
ncbi:MAG: hypothetical protein ABSH11_02170 [Verrucomicrobiota bacterium]|jgi:hypothetical protein